MCPAYKGRTAASAVQFGNLPEVIAAGYVDVQDLLDVELGLHAVLQSCDSGNRSKAMLLTELPHEALVRQILLADSEFVHDVLLGILDFHSLAQLYSGNEISSRAYSAQSRTHIVGLDGSGVSDSDLNTIDVSDLDHTLVRT